jgi:phage N-6-adenine-methyltransferase
MSLVGFKARNHFQQVGKRGPNPKVDDRQTSPEVFDPLHERFGFTIDVAASSKNAKLPRYYTIEDDGLTQPWNGERVWCNPPYSDLEPWVAKANLEFDGYPSEDLVPDTDEWWQAAIIVMLVPANRTEQGWWQREVEPRRDRHKRRGLRTEFLSGRLRFIAHDADEIKPNLWLRAVDLGSWGRMSFCPKCRGYGTIRGTAEVKRSEALRCWVCNGSGIAAPGSPWIWDGREKRFDDERRRDPPTD